MGRSITRLVRISFGLAGYEDLDVRGLDLHDQRGRNVQEFGEQIDNLLPLHDDVGGDLGRAWHGPIAKNLLRQARAPFPALLGL